jgi:hypothetical protein
MPKFIPKAEILENYNTVMNKSRQFGEVETKIMGILELGLIVDTQFWAGLLRLKNKDESIPPNMMAQAHSLYFDAQRSLEFVPKIIELLRRDSDPPTKIIEEMRADLASVAATQSGQLTVILPEIEGRFSSPKRLTMVLESVESLYEAAAIMENLAPSGLIVASCDSGSNKIFDFKGVRKLVSSVQSMLVEAWERYIYYREKQFSQRLKLVSESIPILAKIAEIEEDIGREKAEILRSKITAGVLMFFETGSRIPNMNAHSHFEPAALLRPEDQLLLPPPSELTRPPQDVPTSKAARKRRATAKTRRIRSTPPKS